MNINDSLRIAREATPAAYGDFRDHFNPARVIALLKFVEAADAYHRYMVECSDPILDEADSLHECLCMARQALEEA